MAPWDVAAERVQLILHQLDANQRVFAFVSPNNGELEATAIRQATTFVEAVEMLDALEDDQAADLCERVAQMPWPETQKQMCVRCVQSLLSRRPWWQQGHGRAHLQDFSCMEHHLPKDLWDASAFTFCEQLVTFLVTMMGCIHPTEETIRKSLR